MQFGDSDESSSEFDENTSGLPFPQPLSRASFLTPDFDPATYLASLTDRHQTLEDLRQELRELSQTLSKELLDLVNENYQDFLSLGGTLKGGEEKIEETKLGLLGFRRDVAAIQAKVEARRKAVQSLLEEKKKYRTDVNVGKALLDIADRVEELEERLMIATPSKEDTTPLDGSVEPEDDGLDSDSEESDEEHDQNEEGTAMISIKRLEGHVHKYVYIRDASSRIGMQHPFLSNLEPRLEKIRSTLLLDLDTALEQSRKDKGHRKLLKLYDLIPAQPSSSTHREQV